MLTNDNYIENHYLENLGEHLGSKARQVVTTERQFAMRIYRQIDRLAIATNGLSNIALYSNDDYRNYYTELIIYVPLDWDVESLMNANSVWAWPIDWIRRIASIHVKKQFWLGRGDMADDLSNIDDLERPLAAYSACLYVTEGAPLGFLNLPDGRRIEFYTTYPLYDSEYSFLTASGAVWLLQAFRNTGLSTVTSQLRTPVA